MKITLLSLVIFLLMNCNKEKKDIFFSDNLYREILKYQEKNPIPNNKLSLLSIYDISFSKNKDTLVTITISANGVFDKNSYGIYKGDSLKRTYVIDSQKLGAKFVNIYKRDSIKSYILEGMPPHSDAIYPVYKYKVRGEKLIFIDSLR